MKLKGILSIAGQPGLFKIIAQTRSGFVVEGVSDKKRMPVASTQRISMLEDISVYTTDEDVLLAEVLKSIADAKSLKHEFDVKADPAKLRDEFETCFPSFDKERVYNSDIKKILTWFNLLRDTDAFDEAEAEEEAVEVVKDVKEVKTTSKKKAASKKITKADAGTKTIKKPSGAQLKNAGSKKSI